ncbi:MAG: translocation/assembly module TamB domain-containing protein [Deltaproteobacteria bacterium]|nr:translocation/assembly module TamB domain-containing protein [Deltaproteobacteria bacterium]
MTFYKLKIFWIVIFMIMVTGAIGAANWFLNDQHYQIKAAALVYKLTKTRLAFNNIHFKLFLGEVSGKDLSITAEKTNLSLTLKEFKLNYNPLYLWLAKFKITKVYASQFVLDTSGLIKSENKTPKRPVPDFLKRIKLKEAKIDQFIWKLPDNGILTVDKIRLTSKFGSVLYKSPLRMMTTGIAYQSKKLHAFIDSVELNGFFIFDFSQPRIFDESKLSAKAEIQRALLAVYRTPKPWLSERGWDQDLEPLLKSYYPQQIPADRSYVFINGLTIDAQKTKTSLKLNDVKINFHQAYLAGKGNIDFSRKKLSFNLKTLSDMDLSKLPLGQSKFRQSFEKFSFDLNLDGKYISLDKHDLKTTLKARLIGNMIDPEAGDITAELVGRTIGGHLVSDNLTIELKDGVINASTKLHIKEFTTNTKLNAKNIDALIMVRLFSSVNIPSTVDATGSITGKLNNPRISLDMTTPNATYEFLNFGRANGKLLIDNKNLKLDVKTSGSDISDSELNMTVKDVFASFDSVMDLKSRHAHTDIAKMINAKSLKGTIDGTFKLSRAEAKVRAKGEFKTSDFHFFDHPVGDLSFKLDLDNKHLEVKPVIIDLLDPPKTLTSGRGFAFDFTPAGYTFKGYLTDQLAITGTFEKAAREFLQLGFTPQKMPLDIFTSLLPFKPETSSVSGKIDLKYNIYNPKASQMKSNLTALLIKTLDGTLQLNRPGGIDYINRAFNFHNFDITLGQGKMVLNGPLGMESNTALKIKGTVDFAPLADFNPYISESELPIGIDLTLRDDIFKPKVYGTVSFNKDTIRFRKMHTDLENLSGVVKFDGNRIILDRLSLEYDEAPVKLTGSVTTDYEKITGAELSITGKEVPLHPHDGLSLLADVDLQLSGHDTMTLKGDMNIVEGQYNRDFVITNFIIKPKSSDLDEQGETFAGLPLNTHYKLTIKNTGDLLIRNNLADLELNANLSLLGTIENPDLSGQIDFLGGQINAFGLDFDNATGFAHFKKDGGINPDILVNAKKEIQGYNITARIEGLASNLRLRLDSSPALNHREILSVIFYGQTPDQLSPDSRRNFTQTAAISQLASILANPLNKISGLDVLKVSARQERSSDRIQRLTVGKHLTNRFDLTFTTDLGISDPERAFELRFHLFDNFYLIAAKDVVGSDRYRFDINYRFLSY